MGEHWLKTALERIKAGEEEDRVLLEYGYAKIIVVTEESPKYCTCEEKGAIDPECPMGHGRDLARQLVESLDNKERNDSAELSDNEKSIHCECGRVHAYPYDKLNNSLPCGENSKRRIEMPPSCEKCILVITASPCKYNDTFCHAKLWRYFARARRATL